MKLRNKKTGKIGELSGVNRIVVYEYDMPLCGNSILGEYDTLAELNEEWEDYQPTEPLIKDEKVRKAVRAWAEANGINSRHYHECDIKFDRSEHRLKWIRTSIEFDSIIGLEGLEDERNYAIAELCGEEEE